VNVTALLAHPDDELICAGTLARFVEEGHRVSLLTMFMDEREAEWRACAQALGVTVDFISGLVDDFAWTRRWVLEVEPRVLASAPALLISHRAEDPNTTHGHLGRIALTITRRNRFDLWEMDQTVPGGIDPDAPPPNHFVDITSQIDRKREAISRYPSQLDRYPGWADALTARDRLYGWQVRMTAEPTYAEGFRIVKSVWA
jgi:LmbE family N-acetylglucosaminyl deacetylase